MVVVVDQALVVVVDRAVAMAVDRDGTMAVDLAVAVAADRDDMVVRTSNRTATRSWRWVWTRSRAMAVDLGDDAGQGDGALPGCQIRGDEPSPGHVSGGDPGCSRGVAEAALVANGRPQIAMCIGAYPPSGIGLLSGFPCP